MSLRTRVIAAVGFIAVVLVLALVFVGRATEENLIRQVDEQLADAARPVRGFDFGRRPRRGPRAPELSSLYVGALDGGEVVTLVSPGLRGADVPLPDIDAAEATTAAATGRPFTAGSTGGDLRWRVRAHPAATAGGVVLIGLPLDSVDAAVSDLRALEVVAGAIILLSLGLVAFWVIRLGIRPVHRMTEVATAIAGGDLTQRVPDTDPDTEAGQLGAALNRMLASIEATLADRERAQERLRQFVADASHELRTPLATIRGYAELHRTGALDDPERLDDAMRRTEEESIRMAGLVDDLLALARLDQGRPLELGPVDLSLVAHDAAADARAVDSDRPISVRAEAPTVVLADEARVRQVVANLVANALVHTPPDAAVTITTGAASAGHRFVEVADEGPGMSPETAARAFERFYRADPSRSRHQGGSGLGLAIVEATVRAHGGDVTLRSAPGRGTAVRVELSAAD